MMQIFASVLEGNGYYDQHNDYHYDVYAIFVHISKAILANKSSVHGDC